MYDAFIAEVLLLPMPALMPHQINLVYTMEQNDIFLSVARLS